jgi:hypothetical protein
MKKVLLIILILISMQAFAQTDGLTYQAIIIGPDTQELPGVDAENNILPNTRVAIRFTIIDANNSVEYQEVQTTNTDQYGRINLLIGVVDHDAFTKINWDGTNKDLKVEIDFTGGTDFVDMSREQLTFLPFAFHRNIQATGTLTVDDKTYLNSELTVQGPTQLNSTLDVNNNNETNLSGILNVEGTTYLKDSLSVLNQKNTFLSGDLTVEGKSEFADIETEYLIVEKTSNLKGQVTINANLDDNGEDTEYNAYPLQVEGSAQGIAIKVNRSRSNSTNFITFFDTERNESWGRIEGETEDEFDNNYFYIEDIDAMAYDKSEYDISFIFQSLSTVAAFSNLLSISTDVRPCFGLGGCVVPPSPTRIDYAIARVIVQSTKQYFINQKGDRIEQMESDFHSNRELNKGVTFKSGAGDYAEYLLRENTNETITYGDIVGVNGGKISKNTEGAERMMVISRKPIVLGNMPQPNRENEYEKVAFMGQVPVKVFGKVNIGDYILPSGKNDGIGIGISSAYLTSEHIKKIVGVAWTGSDNISGFNMVTVAVGLNNNDNNPILKKLEKQVQEQSVVIKALQGQIETLISRIDLLEQVKTRTSENESIFYEEVPKTGKINGRKYEIVVSEQTEIIFWEINREDFEKGLELAEKTLQDEAVDLENNEIWRKLKTDSNFKNEFYTKIEEKFNKQMQDYKELYKK